MSGGEPRRFPSPLPVDTLSMWEATTGLPEQVLEAVKVANEVEGLEVAGPVSNVAVLGMGGSGVAGDLVAALGAAEMAVPVTVSKSYEAPAFWGPDTLVIAVSFSGDTAETLEAVAQAGEAGAAVVTITTGGTLGRLASANGWPWVPVPGAIPQPRAALGAMAAPALVVLERLGLMATATRRLEAAAEFLARRREVLCSPGGPADEVARRIGRTFPLMHGSPGPAAVAAGRWKTQVNENVKVPAFASVQPELCHNEVAGWGQAGDITRQVLTLVTLRHEGEHAEVSRRIELVAHIMEEVVADVIEVRTDATDDLARFFDLAFFGDLVSLYMAGREGVDPGPVPVLAEIKSELAAARQP